MSRFHNLHLGETVVLLANGYSLNEMNLDFLKEHIVIGMNKIYLGFKKFNFYPKYYVAINDLVIRQSVEQIRSLSCVKFISRRNKSLLLENALTYHIDTDNPRVSFFKDISYGVNEGFTVTYACLQIAYFMGFKRVIIIGMDHSFSYMGNPNEVKFLEGDDKNHFSPEYFGNQLWQNPDLKKAEKFYRIADEIFTSNGREIIDATFKGNCHIFQKRDYREVFFNA
ncbi:MAG: DUF115 domain-containing protein [Moraxella sp.]|nr:DUF115 domain-containing protein [Moraxella sp.]